MEKKIKLVFLGLVLVSLIWGIQVSANVPASPHRFYGDVTFNEVTGGNNWQVSAKIEGTEVVSTTTVDGYYDFNVPGEEGDTIAFYVEGIDTGTTFTFDPLEITNLDLTVSVACVYGDWQDVGCGEGECSATQMQQERTSDTLGCTDQTQCVTDSSCSSTGGYTPSGGDSTAPSISNIAVDENSTSVTITWTTNESSQSWILYGTSTAYGSEEKTTSYVSSHSLTLTDLFSATTYHYQVKSKDSSGNIGTYTDKTFTTLTAAGEVVGEEEEEEEASKPYSEMTVAELRAEIARILALINTLRNQLALLRGETVIQGIPTSFTFTKSLRLGDVLTDVKYLQIVLNSASDTRLASSGVGSPGYETNYFGSLTKAAVIKFQEKPEYIDDILGPWNLTSGTGYVGSTTRDKLNELLGK